MPAHLSQMSWQCPLLVAKLSLSWVLRMAQTVETVRGWDGRGGNQGSHLCVLHRCWVPPSLGAELSPCPNENPWVPENTERLALGQAQPSLQGPLTLSLIGTPPWSWKVQLGTPSTLGGSFPCPCLLESGIGSWRACWAQSRSICNLALPSPRPVLALPAAPPLHRGLLPGRSPEARE